MNTESIWTYYFIIMVSFINFWYNEPIVPTLVYSVVSTVLYLIYDNSWIVYEYARSCFETLNEWFISTYIYYRVYYDMYAVGVILLNLWIFIVLFLIFADNVWWYCVYVY